MNQGKIKLARDLAKRSKPRFIMIPRLKRHTAYEYHANQWMVCIEQTVTRLLEAEQRRLMRTWNQES